MLKKVQSEESPMSSDDAAHFQALAENLIQTLGPDRAAHVATQFGWYGVVEEIRRREVGPQESTIE